MPDPEDIFNVIRTDSRRSASRSSRSPTSGTRTTSTTIQGTAKHDIHLLGWTGDYNDTDNFIGMFFGTADRRSGASTTRQLFDDLTEARGMPDASRSRPPVYKEINREIMDYLPGVPLAHPAPSLAFAPGRQGLPAEPGARTRSANTVTLELTALTPVAGPAAVADPPAERLTSMLRFVVRRLLQLIPVLLGLSLLLFIWLRALPGGPGAARCSASGPRRRRIAAGQRGATASTSRLVSSTCTYLQALLQRRLRQLDRRPGGRSSTSFLERFPATIELAIAALLFAIVRRHPARLPRRPAPAAARSTPSSVVGSLLGVVDAGVLPGATCSSSSSP